MEHSSLLASPIIRILHKVVSGPQEHRREHRIRMRKRQEVAHRIHTRVVMGEPLRGMLPPEHQIHLMVAKLLLGILRHARPTRTRMVVAKRQLGTPLRVHLIHTKMLLRGMPRREHLIHM